jgi:hypothetical protein
LATLEKRLHSSSRNIAERSIEEVIFEYEVDGLDALIFELKNLKNSGHYEKIFNTYKTWEEPSERLNGEILEEELESRLLNLAYDTLDPPSSRISRAVMINFFGFCWLYPFLELFYFRDIGRKLYLHDLKVLYSSRIDERIVFAFDKFDEVSYIPEPTENFFFDLKNVRWDGRKSKQLFEKLKKIRHFMRYEIVGYLEDITFQDHEDAFIFLIACCSAVDRGGNIDDHDVVRAYTTYFKLIKTDISHLVDNIKVDNNPQETGYLVCERCHGYYKLNPWESPEDFSLCRCQGKLDYYDDIDWLFEDM